MSREEILEFIEAIAKIEEPFKDLLKTIKRIKKEEPELYERNMRLWESKAFEDELAFLEYIN